jgi:UDP-glucose 4-epimerase
MKILVTGGAGFIGSFLTEKICDSNEVLVLDNLSTGSAENLDTIINKIDFIHGDIRDKELVDSLISKCDLIYHLAASVGVKRILEDPQESVSTNIYGSENILNSACRFDKRIVIASTSEIYGKSTKQPLCESDDRLIGAPQNFRWIYSDSKAIEEAIATYLGISKNLRVTIARLFNIVGPRQSSSYGMVLPSFIKSAIMGESVVVHGDGSQKRVFCHVNDAVDALIGLAKNSNTIREVFNVGGLAEISIIDLARLVIEKTHSSSEISFKPYSEVYPVGFEDMLRRQPDLTKIKNFINWSPNLSLEQIIQDSISSHQRITN